MDLLQWFINSSIKRLLVVVFKILLVKYQQKNYTDKLLKNLIKKSTLNFYWQYLGCTSSRYATDKQI